MIYCIRLLKREGDQLQYVLSHQPHSHRCQAWWGASPIWRFQKRPQTTRSKAVWSDDGAEEQHWHCHRLCFGFRYLVSCIHKNNSNLPFRLRSSRIRWEFCGQVSARMQDLSAGVPHKSWFGSLCMRWAFDIIPIQRFYLWQFLRLMRYTMKI